MQKVKILKLSPEDAGLLQACAELEKICIPEEAWSLESFRSEAEKPSGFVLAALDENQNLAGFLTASCILDTADLTNIAVAPEYRRQGIAGLLLKELCSGIGKANLFLEVRESNFPARNFYQKHGFEQVGIRKDFYQHPDENAILMKLESE
ncbi:MAG: ribosomal protein S18-alanine N-acetyltransferase [Oscillospiraceae bacterium]|nr:ribosomal protein S18-alanine N-acetyltransferase [Oscillospiraceae bacterium]